MTTAWVDYNALIACGDPRQFSAGVTVMGAFMNLCRVFGIDPTWYAPDENTVGIDGFLAEHKAIQEWHEEVSR